MIHLMPSLAHTVSREHSLTNSTSLLTENFNTLLHIEVVRGSLFVCESFTSVVLERRQLLDHTYSLSWVRFLGVPW